MPKYIITYLGGDRPATPEEGLVHMAKYKTWLAQLGDTVISPANPFKSTVLVKPDGSTIEGGTTGMSGYTIIEAGSMEVALAVAKNCPFLDVNGSLEVSELIEMNM